VGIGVSSYSGVVPTRRTIGVDIGGTRLLVGAVDAGLDVHHRTQRAVSGLDQPSLLDAAVDAIEEARTAAGSEIAAVGFGIPSPAEASDPTLSPPEAPLADLMAERLGLPAFVDTDANVEALAERRAGAAQGAREAVVLTIGAGGVRSSVILGGELQRRAGRVAAPMTAAELADVVERAHDGDRRALDALASLGRKLGELIASLVALYTPQVVVIGAAMAAAGELLLAPARSTDVPIVAARFGVDATLVGAAALAFDGVERLA
jgi:glucokinase